MDAWLKPRRRKKEMANVKAGGLLKTAAAPGATAPAQKSVAAVMNGILDPVGCGIAGQ